MKHYLLVLCIIIVCFQVSAQSSKNSAYCLKFQSGYASKSLKGNGASGLDAGANFRLSLDRGITHDGFGYIGLGLGYVRSEFANILHSNINADINYLSVRGGWIAPITQKIDIGGTLECGPAYMQSRHQYNNARYRTKNNTIMIGIEVNVDYYISEHWGVSASYGVTKFGNDNLQYKDSPSCSVKPLNFCPTNLNLGLFFHF